jgi:hypothetical protein
VSARPGVDVVVHLDGDGDGDVRRDRTGLILAVAAALLISGCARDPVSQLISQLGEPARREQAIDALVQRVRQEPRSSQAQVKDRVVRALIEAYSEDESRAELVAALAVLRDDRAEEVFAAALRDADRGGSYYEAAVRAARMIGELGLRRQIPALIAALRKAQSTPRADRASWLERSLIHALDRLGDRQAVDVLIEVLRADPAQQDFHLNRMAAATLGRIGDSRAMRPLVAALATASHGLLLYEECRRALCRLGSASAAELLAAAARRDRQHQPEANATAAVQVLSDIGDSMVARRVAALPKPKDPDGYRLAVAETLFRLSSTSGEAIAQEVFDDENAALTHRRQAAELLGWYGSGGGATLLEPCASAGAEQNVLCWTGALAYARLAGAEGVSRIDALINARATDAATQRYLQSYRPRLALVASCGPEQRCYDKELDGDDWRSGERAGLELGRIASRQPTEVSVPDLALRLARAFPAAHPQKKQAILVSLERIAHGSQRLGEVAAQVARLIQARSAAKDGEQPPPDIVSRALCLGERLRRGAGK